MIQIKIEEEIVNLYKNRADSPIYQISKAELPLIRKHNEYEASEWIDHLMAKSWMEIDTLYELAVIIQKEFPENNFDWEETFFPVEKRAYLQHVKKTKNLMTDKKDSKLSFKSLMETIETGLEEQNDFVNIQVGKITRGNLKKYELI